MKLPEIPQEYSLFVNDTLAIAKRSGVKMKFKKTKLVYFNEDDKTGSAGYFSSDPLELVMSIKSDNIETIMALLLHESCHMDQYLHNRVEWEKTAVSYGIFFSWLDGDDSYTDHEIQLSVNDVIELELDCERRSVKKLKKYDLPIDLEMYKKKANSYLYALRYFSQVRKWYNRIYEHEDNWKNAPLNFRNNYEVIPKKLLKAYKEYTQNI